MSLLWEIILFILPSDVDGYAKLQTDGGEVRELVECGIKHTKSLATSPSTMDIASQENTWRAGLVYLRCCSLLQLLDEGSVYITNTVLKSPTNLLEKVVLEGLNNYNDILKRLDVGKALITTLRAKVSEVLECPSVAHDIQFIDNLAAILESLSIATRISKDTQLLNNVDEQLICDLWLVRRVQNQAVAAPIFKVQAGFTSSEIRRNPSGVSTQIIKQLTDELYRSSHWDQPVDVRLGCVEAIKELDLNAVYESSRNNKDTLHPFVLSLIRVSCILLNDESEDVRDKISEVIYPSPSPDVTGTWESVPGLHCPETSIEHCFSWITHMATASPIALESALFHLGGILIHPEEPGHSSIFYSECLSSASPPQLPFASETVAGQSNVIFELEDHNHHAEDLLTMQLAVRELLLLGSKEGIEKGEIFKSFVKKLAARLIVEAEAVVKALGSVITPENRILAFPSIYRLRAGASLCANFDPTTEASKVFDLLPLHPCDNLWLSGTGTDKPRNQAWDDLLFLIPRKK